MNLQINPTAALNGANAAGLVAAKLNEAIAERGCARLLLSTGASQFEMFEALVTLDVDWSKVEMFHLDEYVALPITHIASFRKYLTERFVDRLPTKLKAVHFVHGEGDVEANIQALTEAITVAPIDVGLIGIGENGHIAFNDPPADFEKPESYHVVDLDDRCKAQQVGEGWFATPDDVPKQAISMTVSQIMKCRCVISVVPHTVKAEAIYKMMTKPLTNLVPATMLKKHPDFHLFIDYDSAKLIYDSTGL